MYLQDPSYFTSSSHTRSLKTESFKFVPGRGEPFIKHIFLKKFFFKKKSQKMCFIFFFLLLKSLE